MKLSSNAFNGLAALALIFTASACNDEQKPSTPLPVVMLPPSPLVLTSSQKLITIIGTNDIHGSVEPTKDAAGIEVGGMATLASTVKAIKQGLKNQFGENAGVLTVDGGDQFQGTLISNFNEGELVFKLMNEVGYDAVVPGNHDYDFGPIGWLDDQVNEKNPDKDPRGALMKLKAIAKFPLISANTYFKKSLKTATGQELGKVEGVLCKTESKEAIDWSKAERPSFLQPYVIKQVAGVRVALIGLDNPITPQSTTAANVSDLCFRGEADTYREVRAELEGKADVFVIVIHNGNIKEEKHVSTLVSELTRGKKLVDAVVAGHTHSINNEYVNGVPIIQSGANGQMFGRIDLVWDDSKGKLISPKIRKAAGITLMMSDCARVAEAFCEKNEKTHQVDLEGAPLQKSEEAENLIASAKGGDYAKTAGKVLALAKTEINKGNSFQENALSNVLTDLLRDVTKADVAFMNTGGMRTAIKEGPLTYEAFYRVLPFNNRGVIIGPMKAGKIRSLVERSLKGCTGSGALMQSGLRVEFERNCEKPVNGKDEKARALKITMLSGEVILDVASGIWNTEREFIVGTLDFLQAGGSGYTDFKSAPLIQGIGIVREAMVDHILGLGREVELSSTIDGRWKETLRVE